MSNQIVGNTYVGEDGNPLLDPTTSEPPGGPTALDEYWLKGAFVLPDDPSSPNVERVDAVNRYWSSASVKFTDGRFGCNIGINCQPQFTSYADYPTPNRLAGREEASIHSSSTHLGLGGFWTSAFDDPEQIIFLRFGVPEFNSILNFFSGAYDYGASVLVRTGRMPTFFYDMGKLLGNYLMFRSFPLVTVALAVYKTADYFFGRQSSKYYHMKPTMHLYWSAVNAMANTMLINMGIYPKIFREDTAETRRLGMPLAMDDTEMGIYSELAPDIFDASTNYFDAFAFATRAQRIANELIHQEFEQFNTGTATDWAGHLKKTMNGVEVVPSKFTNAKGEMRLMAFLEEFTKLGDFYSEKERNSKIEETPPAAKDGKTYDPLYSESAIDNFKKHLTAEFRQGGNFAVFRVSNTGSKSESFSNNTQSSGMQNKLNSIVSNFQEHRFTFGGVGEIAGDTVGRAFQAVQDVAMAALDTVTFDMASSLKGLLGEGYVDIPEHWQSSSSSLPSAQYKISLEAWNGSPLTRFMKLYVPFCMIAAGAWPRSVGRSAYGSPFLCQVYDRGRVQIPLGIITEFTVSRGLGNIGYTVEGAPLSMDISFTIKDLSTILHMPLVAGNILEGPAYVDEDSTVTNYLATVSGQSMYSQIYPSSKAKIRAAKAAMKVGQISSPAFWASTVHDNLTDGPGKILTLGLGSLFESLQRNPESASGSM